MSINSFFSTNSAIGLELFRVALGFILAFDFFLFTKNFGLLISRDSVLDLGSFLSVEKRFWSLFQYRRMTEGQRRALLYVAEIASICLALGLLTKISAFVCLIVFVSVLHRNSPATANGGRPLVVIFLYYLLFSPVGSLFSLDHYWQTPQWIHFGWHWAFLACKIQMNLLYLGAVINKLSHKDWLDGTMAYKSINSSRGTIIPQPAILHTVAGSRIATYSIVGVQAIAPFLLWFDSTKFFAIAALALLHLGMSLYINATTFPAYMLAGLILFY